MINPKYEIHQHQGMRVLKLVMEELDFEQVFLFDELKNRWLAPIKVLCEDTFQNAKRLGVAFVKIASSINDKDWFFDSRFVLDHGSDAEKEGMKNLLKVLNFKKRTGKLQRI